MKLSLQQKAFAGVALAIALLTYGWCARRDGVRAGQVNQQLVQLGQQKKGVDKKIVADRKSVAVAKKAAAVAVRAADTAARDRTIARKKIELKGDTATTASGTQVLLPEISDFIRTSDVSSARDSVAMTALAAVAPKQDTLEADHTARESIDDKQSGILLDERHPRCGLKCGAALGAGAALIVIRLVALLF